MVAAQDRTAWRRLVVLPGWKLSGTTAGVPCHRAWQRLVDKRSCLDASLTLPDKRFEA